MALFVSSLNSGSNGNCYYVGTENEAVLVDAGIPCREIESRMKKLSLSVEKLKGIFISHEHTDHIRGVAVFAKKYRLPVYVTSATLKNCGFRIAPVDVRKICNDQQLQIGSLTIDCFGKHHDAADPISFTVSSGGVKVGVFTDIGAPCMNLHQHFRQCHAAFLESNYDEEMLEKGSYPFYLKHRIRGGKGHLSNRQALEVFNSHRPAFMSHLFLSHLSKENNCPELVASLFQQHAGNTSIVVASRYEQTPVYRIEGGESIQAENHLPLFLQQPQLQFDF